MEPDDAPPRADDALVALVRQDLNPLSRVELLARIAALEGEIARTRARMDHAASERASAEALFRR